MLATSRKWTSPAGSFCTNGVPHPGVAGGGILFLSKQAPVLGIHMHVIDWSQGSPVSMFLQHVGVARRESPNRITWAWREHFPVHLLYWSNAHLL